MYSLFFCSSIVRFGRTNGRTVRVSLEKTDSAGPLQSCDWVTRLQKLKLKTLVIVRTRRDACHFVFFARFRVLLNGPSVFLKTNNRTALLQSAFWFEARQYCAVQWTHSLQVNLLLHVPRNFGRHRGKLGAKCCCVWHWPTSWSVLFGFCYAARSIRSMATRLRWCWVVRWVLSWIHQFLLCQILTKAHLTRCAYLEAPCPTKTCSVPHMAAIMQTTSGRPNSSRRVSQTLPGTWRAVQHPRKSIFCEPLICSQHTLDN